MKGLYALKQVYGQVNIIQKQERFKSRINIFVALDILPLPFYLCVSILPRVSWLYLCPRALSGCSLWREGSGL